MEDIASFGSLLGFQKVNGGSMIDKLTRFVMKIKEDANSAGLVSSENSSIITVINLWDYLIGKYESLSTKEKVHIVFKSKDPKRYIQVKTALINNGT